LPDQYEMNAFSAFQRLEEFWSLFDAGWLGKPLQVGQAEHYLHYWHRVTNRMTFDQFRGFPQVVGLIEIMDAIEIVRDHSLPGWARRAQRIQDKEEVHSRAAVEEFFVASQMLKAGNKVQFIDEQKGVRTADLLINDDLEIECKSKSSHQLDNKVLRQNYGRLNRTLKPWFMNLPGRYGFRLHVDFDQEPTERQMKEISDWIGSHDEGARGMEQSTRDGTARFTLTRLDYIGPMLAHPAALGVHGVDYANFSARDFRPGEVDKPFLNTANFGEERNYSSSVEGTLRKAVGQFSLERASMISVALNGEQLERAELEALMSRFFNAHPGVSAVNLYDREHGIGTSNTLARVGTLCLNGSADIALPTKYIAMLRS